MRSFWKETLVIKAFSVQFGNLNLPKSETQMIADGIAVNILFSRPFLALVLKF